MSIAPQATILIVDDTPANLGVLFDFLADAGYKVLVAQGGNSALQKVEYALPDLILLDILMPDMDGYETCRQLKARERVKDIPVIFMTALSDTVDKIRGLQLGAVDYVTKPLQHEEVLARIKLHLNLGHLNRQLQAQNLQLEQQMQERILAEEALRQSEVRFRTIVDTAQEGIWSIARQGTVTYVNQRLCDMLGYPAAEILGRSFLDFIPASLHPEALQNLERRQQGIQEQYDFLFRCQDGSDLWAIVAASPMWDATGQFLGEIEMLTDITDRKRSEQKIREQAALLDITTDAIFVCDLEYRILYWNQGAQRVYGWTETEALGRNIIELLYRNPQPQLPKIQQQVIAEGEWHGELHKVTKAGKDILVESRRTLMRDPQGQPKSILAVDTDITEQKQLEQQLLRSQRMDSIGTLAGGIAHDLNNVLTPILMSVQLLGMKHQDQQSQQWLEILETNTRRGAGLIRQVMAFARGVDGKRIPLQTEHLIWEIKKLMEETFPKSITIAADIAANLWAVCGDVTQLHQVLMNLCINARDAMPTGGKLQISAQNRVFTEADVQKYPDIQAGSYVELTVMDTGIGIAPEVIDRIFDPFFTTKEFGEGTGLGLSTVVGIVKSHAGTISVTSQPDQGSQFAVLLPAITAPLFALNEDLEIPAGHGETVLIVDDEAAIREITQTSLEAYGYHTLIASDGMEAIALYIQHRREIDLVMVDLMMPEMDGTLTIRTLQEINPDVKIVAISGAGQPEGMSNLTATGIQAFLLKPLATRELLTTLNQVISSTKECVIEAV